MAGLETTQRRNVPNKGDTLDLPGAPADLRVRQAVLSWTREFAGSLLSLPSHWQAPVLSLPAPAALPLPSHCFTAVSVSGVLPVRLKVVMSQPGRDTCGGCRSMEVMQRGTLSPPQRGSWHHLHHWVSPGQYDYQGPSQPPVAVWTAHLRYQCSPQPELPVTLELSSKQSSLCSIISACCSRAADSKSCCCPVLSD